MSDKQNLLATVAQNWEHFVALVLLILVAFFVTFIAEKLARKEELKRDGRAEAMFSIRKITIIGVFSAISFVLMFIEFPLFFAPSFYKFDFSDIPALIGGFACGPMAAVMIEFVKVLLNVLIQGTTSGFVGEIANFVVGAAFVVPATVIYRFKKSRRSALISCLVGTVCIAFVGAVLNAFFLLPAYAVMFGSGIDTFIQMGTAINPAVNNVFTFCLLCVAPFNLLKGIADSVITFLVYKQLSPILKADKASVSKKIRKSEAEAEG